MSRRRLNSVDAVAAALGAVSPGNAQVARVVTDTRKVGPGDVFVALVGERFDAHDFLAQARDAGAVAAVVSRPVADALAQIVVPDTRLALGLLARAQRLEWAGELIAVTGNSGKTTVKEMIAAILRRSSSVLSTQGNLNNDIGAPLTLLGLGEEHRHAVIELGANHLGEIAWTAMLARPRVAVITNVTGAHVGEFGGMGQIAQAKAEILAGLNDDGIAVLNRDDRFYPLWRALAGQREVVDFGFSAAARVRGCNLACDAQGRYAFTLVVEGSEAQRIRLAVLGRHNVLNALAAAAATLALGVSQQDVVDGLESCRSLQGRLSRLQGLRGSWVLDDTYNANPGAMRAAMQALADMPEPRWCFLGAMGELGAESEQLHAEVGRAARELGIDFLGTFGAPARAAAEAFGEGGCHFDDWAALTRYARDSLPPGASVLVKGSRSAGMERLVAELRAETSR
ncbi:UDP-N-acetylmuramoyl-tripeptide--D-alanyl-D-alanine ligase [Halomonas sp. WWR20]